jgi:hypothetical protein
MDSGFVDLIKNIRTGERIDNFAINVFQEMTGLLA